MIRVLGFWAVSLCVSAFSALDVPLEVANWADIARTGEPVTQGVCLPGGAVNDLSKLRITNASGTAVPAQFRALTRWWAEKHRLGVNNPSVKWVLCDFQADVPAGSKALFNLKDDNAGATPPSPLSLTQDASRVTVVTGPLKFTVSKTAFNLFDEAWLDANRNSAFESGEQVIVSSAQNGGFAVPKDWAAGECVSGTIHSSCLRPPDRVIIEEEGPLKIVLRVEGKHYAAANGVTRGLYGYQVFITAYADKPFVDVQWAITNLYMEGDKPGETGTADPYEVFVWPLSHYLLNFNLNLGASQTRTLLAAAEVTGAASATPARLFQDSAGYTITGATGGVSSLGAVSLSDNSLGLMMAMRDFAVNNPKAISVSQNKISLELFPATGETHWLDPYTRKNHRMRLKFFSGAPVAGSLLALHKETHAPLRMIASREWYQACRAWDRGFGIIPYASWDRKAPAGWTRLNQAAGQLVKHLPDNNFSPVNWTSYGQVEEFNGGGGHWNMVSCFFDYLQTGDPVDFEDPESKVFHFNDIVPVQFSWHDDPWAKLDFFLNAENHLANLNSYHGSNQNMIFGGTAVNFPGWAYHRNNIPDIGHMTQLQEIEYYQLTGDPATLDAIKAMGVRGVASMFSLCYFAAGRTWSTRVNLDSALIYYAQQRYVARPGIVCMHAYEATGDERFLWPGSIAAYSQRNYTRQNPAGYMGKEDDRSYLPNTDAGVLALWKVNHPADTAFPRSFHANDFMIGIAHECMYNYWKNTGDRKIRDAIIFSSKSMEWRAGMRGSTYLGFAYGGWADYLQEGRRYSESVGLADSGSFSSSMSEALSGFVFGYLASGRRDLWPVIADARARWLPGWPEYLQHDVWEAAYRHDSVDITPPARVGDLAAVFEDGSGVRLSWTAPGDDGAVGTAAEYQIKAAKAPIVDIPERWNPLAQTGWPDLRPPLPYTAGALLQKAADYKKNVEISFWAADNISGNPAPQAGGTAESFLLNGLDSMTRYYIALVAFDGAGNVSDISNVASLTTGIEAGTGSGGGHFTVAGNSPNPFNPVTAIRYFVPGKFSGTPVSLRIFDPRGKLIRSLVSGPAQPGLRTAYWDGRDELRRQTATGLYVFRLTTVEGKFERRMLLLK